MAWNLFEFEEEIKKAKEPKTESPKLIDFRNWVFETNRFKKYDQVLLRIIMSWYTSDYFDLEKDKYEEECKIIENQLKSYWEVFTGKNLTIAVYFNNERYTLIFKPKGDYIVTTDIKDFEDEVCFPACAIWWYDEQGNRVESNEYMQLKNKSEEEYLHQLLDKAYEKYGNKYNIDFKDRRDYYFHKLLGFENWSKPRFNDSPSKNWFSFSCRVGTYGDMIAYFQKQEASQITVTYQFDHTATSDEVIEKMRDVESKKKQLMPDHYVYKGFEINKNGSKYNLTLIYVDKKYKVDEGEEI
jgi:hypothetical protein